MNDLKGNIFMKIWIADLILIYNDENKWEAIFDFELSDKEWEFNQRNNSYTYFKEWVSDSIPVKMEVDRTWSGNLKVKQGFDRELTEEELKELEKKMKVLLLKKLEIEKDNYLRTYENKVKSIRGNQ